MRDDEGREVELPRDRADAGLDRLLDEAVQGRKRFVQKEEPGLHDEGARERDALALPAREFLNALVDMTLQTEKLDQVVEFFGGRPVGEVPQTVDDVLVGVEVGKERVVLKDDVEAALFHRNVRQILAVIDDAPGARLGEPEHEVQKRALAAARGAEDRDDFAFGDRKRDALEDRTVAVGLGEVLEFKHFCRCGFRGNGAHYQPPVSSSRVGIMTS